MKLYGIPNCDTVKKARAWLDTHRLAHDFHDFKKPGVSAAWLQKVTAQTGWQALLNQRGTTWRKLDEATKSAVIDQASACADAGTAEFDQTSCFRGRGQVSSRF